MVEELVWPRIIGVNHGDQAALKSAKKIIYTAPPGSTIWLERELSGYPVADEIYALNGTTKYFSQLAEYAHELGHKIRWIEKLSARKLIVGTTPQETALASQIKEELEKNELLKPHLSELRPFLESRRHLFELNLSPETRKKVETAIQDLQYDPEIQDKYGSLNFNKINHEAWLRNLISTELRSRGMFNTLRRTTSRPTDLVFVGAAHGVYLADHTAQKMETLGETAVAKAFNDYLRGIYEAIRDERKEIRRRGEIPPTSRKLIELITQASKDNNKKRLVSDELFKKISQNRLG